MIARIQARLEWIGEWFVINWRMFFHCIEHRECGGISAKVEIGAMLGSKCYRCAKCGLWI